MSHNYTYSAFGEIEGRSGSTQNSYLFAGEQWDEGLNGYYLRDRFYSADTGRFTRRDTYVGRISEPVTLHKYIYAHSNPISGIDPSGFMTMSDIGATLNILNQIAARSYAIVANPVTIEVAKAWAMFFGVRGCLKSQVRRKKALRL